jgi:transcriptional regulator with XRE-family HTH domain
MKNERIKELRENKTISQTDLAKILNITPQAVSLYEKNRTPSLDILNKMADYFGVTTDYLIGRSEFKTFEEELQHKDKLEKLGIKNDTLPLTNEERERIINSTNLLYNSLVEFFSSHASDNSVLKSNTPQGDIVFNGAMVFDIISNFSQIINIISELYKSSAHNCKYEEIAN